MISSVKSFLRFPISQENFFLYFADFASYGEALSFVSGLTDSELVTIECFPVFKGAVVSLVSQNRIPSLQDFFIGAVDASFIQILMGRTGASMEAFCVVCESTSATDLIKYSHKALEKGFHLIEIRISKSRPVHHLVLTSKVSIELSDTPMNMSVRSFSASDSLKIFFN